jgi:hypothetical protein
VAFLLDRGMSMVVLFKQPSVRGQQRMCFVAVALCRFFALVHICDHMLDRGPELIRFDSMPGATSNYEQLFLSVLCGDSNCMESLEPLELGKRSVVIYSQEG